jgi:predicted transcriptional regulator
MPEATDVGLQKVDPHLTSKIVRSYVSHHTVGAGEVSALITSVHGALSQLGRPNHPEELTPAVPVRQSVRHDYVVCLNCGYRAKVLRRHIVKQHNLSSAEYLRQWGLRKDHPLTAPGYSEHRSTLAKQLGLGRRSTTEAVSEQKISQPAAANPKLAVNANPKPRRIAGSKSRSSVANKTVSKSTTRQRRSRSPEASGRH